MPTSFAKKVLALTTKIPRGKITTYQAIARALGRPKASRAVGNALNKNPNLIKIPCHRVVRTDKTVGGYVGGTCQKKKMLKKEGIKIKNNKIIGRIYAFK